MKHRNRQIDLIVLAVLPIVLASVCLYFGANFAISTFILFGVPLFYLLLRMIGRTRLIIKTSIFAFLFSIPFTLIFDYLMVRDRGWFIEKSIFPYRLFGVIAIEQFIWSFLWVLFVVVFYEYFLESHSKKSVFATSSISRRMEFFAIMLFSLLAIFILVIFINPHFLQISYAYLTLGIILGIIPLSIFLFKFPNLTYKFSKITAYFFFLDVVVEYVGLSLNHWSFPGNHFLGTLVVSGFVLPYEEILIYFIVSTPGILAYYEFLDDDQR
jgi:hypothetical protein